MPKVTLDMNTFKALASNTRLTILKALDGKKLNLKDICDKTKLNKATLHEHLTKLSEAGLVKRKERSGHKWVYYSLTWRGESLLHPENTKIVVLFTMTFITIAAGIFQMINYVKGYVIARAVNFIGRDSTIIYDLSDNVKKGVSNSIDNYGIQSSAPVADVPLQGQTLDKLSINLVENSDKIKTYTNPASIKWVPEPDSAVGYVNETFRFNLNNNASKITETAKDFCHNDQITNEGSNALSENIANVPQSMVAIAHDQNIQLISIALIVISIFILSIAMWTFWKNKKYKL